MADWLKSRGHQLFLSAFLRPRRVDDLPASTDWKLILGEEPQAAIERFLDSGALVPASLSERVSCKFTVRELEDMLRNRGLSPAGRNKQDLVLRLIQTHPEDMKQAAMDLTVLKCSEKGEKIVEHFLTTEGELPIRHDMCPTDKARKVAKWILGAAGTGAVGGATYDALRRTVERNQVQAHPSASAPSPPVADATGLRQLPEDTWPSYPLGAKRIIIITDEERDKPTLARCICQEIYEASMGECGGELLQGVIIQDALPLVKGLVKEIHGRGDTVVGLLIDLVDETHGVPDAGSVLLHKVKSDTDLKSIPVVIYVSRPVVFSATELMRMGAKATALMHSGAQRGQLGKQVLDAFEIPHGRSDTNNPRPKKEE
ncbi:MAG: SAP domain-containing protein [Phycisphaerales bacterium]|nr:MAG: SAP domain-containing protein [Phycisphaerales bacterium]